MNIEIWAALTIGLIVYLIIEFVSTNEIGEHLKKVDSHLCDLIEYDKVILQNTKEVKMMIKKCNITVKYHACKKSKDRSR